MKVDRKQLNDLFDYLGSDNPAGWADELILKKCNNPGHLEVLRDGGDIADMKLAGLYNTIVKAVQDGETVELEGAGPKATGNGKPKPPPKAKGGVTVLTEDDLAGPAKKVKAKPIKAAAKPSSNGKARKEADKDLRGPGVIDSMIRILQTASKDKPLTKKQVLDRLANKFKDRDPASMWNTTSSYIPNRIYVERGFRVDTDGDGGYWIGPRGNVGKPSEAEVKKFLAGLRQPKKAEEKSAKASAKGKAPSKPKAKAKKKLVAAK